MSQQGTGVNPQDILQNAGQLREGESAPAIGNPEVESILRPSVPETLTAEIESNETDGQEEELKLPYDNLGSISVRPFVDQDKENMGLETYGFVIFEGTAQEEQLACIEKNGVVRYITGLDEYAPEVQLLKDKDKKKAVIRNIRRIVAKLEAELATNILDIDDKEFWNKVKRLRPDNHDFWSGITLTCTNQPNFLNHKTDPFDLIKLMAIEAGGFTLCAKSYEDAQSRSQTPKFYLDKEVDTVRTRIEYKRLKNKAIGLLEKLFENNPKKLLFVTKVVDGNSPRYKYNTPISTLYDIMDEWIHGKGAEQNKSRAAESFIKAAESDTGTLKLRAMVKDASYYKFISPRPDGGIYHMESGEMLGKNVSDVVQALKGPMHEDVAMRLLEEVEYYWKQ